MRERLMSELGQIKSMKVGDSSSDVNNTKVFFERKEIYFAKLIFFI